MVVTHHLAPDLMTWPLCWNLSQRPCFMSPLNFSLLTSPSSSETLQQECHPIRDGLTTFQHLLSHPPAGMSSYQDGLSTFSESSALIC